MRPGTVGVHALFEALVLMLAQHLPFRAVAHVVTLSPYRVQAICNRYAELTLVQTDFLEFHQLAIDKTSQARGHDYVTLAADEACRRIIFVTEGRDNSPLPRELDAVLAKLTTKRTAQARVYRGQLHRILERKQINVLRIPL